ncbi:ribonuclease P [Candidatus Bathyarchaeota archaeon]|nr:ribonuclease P [Candidatus Bathyarchaeota archaeon]
MKTRISVERMQILYQEAQKTVKTEPELAQKYIHLLRRIAQRTRTKIPPHIQHNICKKCNTPLIPGYNATTRINQRREPHVTTTCHTCGYIKRVPIGEKT